MANRIVRGALAFALFTAGVGLGQSFAAEDGTFQCSATGGADFCSCKGAQNCSAMRKSGSCSSALVCTVTNGVTSCTCTAALNSHTGGLRTKQPTKVWRP